MRWSIMVLGALACAEPLVPERTVQGLQRGDAEPTVFLDAPNDEIWLTPGVVSGRVADPDQSPTLLPVTVASDVDGVLWRGNAGSGGVFAWDGALSIGAHRLTATVEDREGNVAEATLDVLVRTNEAPLCGIVAPDDGTRVPRRSPVDLRAIVSDPDGDPVELFWRSSLSGPMFMGIGRTWQFTRAGEHTIRVVGEDPFDGECTDEIRILVE